MLPAVILLSLQILFAAELKEDRILKFSDHEKVALGAAVMNADKEDLEKTGLSEGVVIKDIVEDSEAERLGLQKGDIISKWDGRKIENARQLRDLVGNIKEPEQVKFEIIRDGKKLNLTADLKPSEPQDVIVKFDGKDLDLDFDFDFDHDFSELENLPQHLDKAFVFMGNKKGGYLGVEVTNLTDQLKAYFEVENGVLVESVGEKSAADSAGIKAGDIITEVAGKTVKDYSDLQRYINFFDPGETVTLKIKRKGRSQEIKARLSKQKNRRLEESFSQNMKELKNSLKIKKIELDSLKDNIEKIKIDIEVYII